MIETKIEKVVREQVQKMIDYYQQFGWTATNFQEMINNYNEDQWDNSRNAMVTYEVTEKWTNITFQRDKDMPNYKRICEIERAVKEIDAGIPTPAADKLRELKKGLEIWSLIIFPLGIWQLVLISKQKKLAAAEAIEVNKKIEKNNAKRRELMKELATL
jgi:hypothetical protein